jgi:xylulose-5-phosphate/fructose-6-phosphate phosphoketolase
MYARAMVNLTRWVTGTLLRPRGETGPANGSPYVAQPSRQRQRLLCDLLLPAYRVDAVPVPSPRTAMVEATRMQGQYLRDVMKLNEAAKNFPLFSPDELASNR